MKLFVWEGVLYDHTSGIAFALAENADEARMLIYEKYKQDHKHSQIIDELISDLKADPLIVDNKEGFYLWGGG